MDFGCGHPLLAKMLVQFGYKVTPYEPYAGDVELRTAKLLGLSDIYVSELNPNQQFDLVLMIDVIEHLSIIKPVMLNVYNLIKAKGALFISTPNVLRIEMWYAFVMRKTGHPQDLLHYLESDNNYTHHQREFTMNELKVTMQHFGLKTEKSTCLNTRPSIEDLNQLRIAKNLSLKPKPRGIKLIRELLFKSLRYLFPQKLNNNLILIARK